VYLQIQEELLEVSMAFNVSELSAQLNKHGVAVNNLFVARFTLPGAMNDAMGPPEPGTEILPIADIPFFCRSAQLPDLEVNVTDVKTQGHGVSQKRATAMENNIVPVVFMVDSNFAIKKLFHQWNQSIFNHGNGGGVLESTEDGRKLYEYNFHDDYSSVLEIVVYSYNQEQVTYSYKFNGAFPVSVGGVQVAWENGAEVMTFTVNFAYDSFSVSGAKDGKVEGLDSSIGLLGFLSSINSVAQSVKSIKKPKNVQDLITQTNNVGTLLNTLPF
jgi:hypothetical protein